MKAPNEKLLAALVGMLTKHGASKISLFGSYARGEQKKGSDIDVIVDFSEQKSLLELASMEAELGKKLGVKVDLQTEGSISPYLISRIKAESRVLYS